MAIKLLAEWSTPFGRFIREYGVTRLAQQLQVTTPAIYQWISGFTSPLPQHMLTLIVLSRGTQIPLDITDICAQRDLGEQQRFKKKIEREGDAIHC
jgi:hypothetical protein